jgi:hypothetical protein
MDTQALEQAGDLPRVLTRASAQVLVGEAADRELTAQ